eukprot:6197599-Pleurochrysis_carterae.AAC.2
MERYRCPDLRHIWGSALYGQTSGHEAPSDRRRCASAWTPQGRRGAGAIHARYAGLPRAAREPADGLACGRPGGRGGKYESIMPLDEALTILNLRWVSLRGDDDETMSQAESEGGEYFTCHRRDDVLVFVRVYVCPGLCVCERVLYACVRVCTRVYACVCVC